MKGLFIKDFITSKKIILGTIGISFIFLLIWNAIFNSTENSSVLLFMQLCELILISMVLNVMLIFDDKTSRFNMYQKVVPISNKVIIGQRYIYSFIVNCIYVLAGLITVIIVDKGSLVNVWWILYIILPISIIFTGLLNMIGIISDKKIAIIILAAFYPLIFLSTIIEKWNNADKDTIFYHKKDEILIATLVIYLVCYILTVLIDTNKEKIVHVLRSTRLAFVILGITLVFGIITYIFNLDIVYKAKIDKTFTYGNDYTYVIGVTNIDNPDSRDEYVKLEKKYNKFANKLGEIPGIKAAGYYTVDNGAIDNSLELTQIIQEVQKEDNYIEYSLKGRSSYLDCINMNYSAFKLFNITLSDGLVSKERDKYKSDKYETIFIYLGSGYKGVKGLDIGDSYTYEDDNEIKIKYVIAGILDSGCKLVDDSVMYSDNDMKNPVIDLKYQVICETDAWLRNPIYVSLDSNITTKDAFKKIEKVAKKYDYKITITNMNDVLKDSYKETIIDYRMQELLEPLL